MLPNRLSQVCNLNYQRAMEMLDQLEKKGLVSRMVQDGHDLYNLTQDGLKVSTHYQWINAMVMGDAPGQNEMSRR